MNGWLWFIVSTLGMYIGVIWAFVAIMHAKAVLNRGEKIAKAFLYPLYLLGVIGVLLDVAFNWTLGCLIFHERPKKITFTSRCKMHKRYSQGWKNKRATWWCREMNKFDKGHC